MAINSINYLNPIKANKLDGVDKFCHCHNLDLLEEEEANTRKTKQNKKLFVRNKMGTNVRRHL